MNREMEQEMADAIERVKKMSEELNIEYHPQDWGICNGSADKIEVFVDYFEKGFEAFHSTARFELFELIVASFNDAAMNGTLTNERQALLQVFLKKYSSDDLYRVILDYWGRNVDDLIAIGDYLNLDTR